MAELTAKQLIRPVLEVLADGLELAVVEYISWFNNDRLHESLGDIPPVEFEQAHRDRIVADSLRSPYGLTARIGDPTQTTTPILPTKKST